jgi:hypothetical protein
MKAILIASAAILAAVVSATELKGGRLGSPDPYRHKKDPEKLKALYQRYP